MYIVSPFTPIFFKPSTDMCRASGKYMQNLWNNLEKRVK